MYTSHNTALGEDGRCGGRARPARALHTHAQGGVGGGRTPAPWRAGGRRAKDGRSPRQVGPLKACPGRSRRRGHEGASGRAGHCLAPPRPLAPFDSLRAHGQHHPLRRGPPPSPGNSNRPWRTWGVWMLRRLRRRGVPSARHCCSGCGPMRGGGRDARDPAHGSPGTHSARSREPAPWGSVTGSHTWTGAPGRESTRASLTCAHPTELSPESPTSPCTLSSGRERLNAPADLATMGGAGWVAAGGCLGRGALHVLRAAGT